jgi:hypothetical protein
MTAGNANRLRVLVVTFCLALTARPVSAQEAVFLRENFVPGYAYHVSSRVELSGSLTLPPEKDKPSQPLSVTGTGAIEYDELVLNRDKDGQVQKTLRVYRQSDVRRKVGDQPQQSGIRPEVRRQVLLRHKQNEVPFSPDGPLLWAEIDLVRTDVFTPALTGMLPAQAVRPGAQWDATLASLQELTDLEKVDSGSVRCRYEQETVVANRRHARVAFAGTVRGTGEDGPTSHTLDGYYLFDLQSQHLSYLFLKGVQTLLDKDGKPAGRVEGQFTLTRQVGVRCPEFAADALKRTALEPNDDNTQLLYDNPELGVRLLYPRRWRVGAVRERQMTIEEGKGSGLLLTVEQPSKLPTGAQYLTESKTWLEKQKVLVLGSLPPRVLQKEPLGLEHFALNIQVGQQKFLMDYFVVRQPAGGATVAARLVPTDNDARRDVVRIVHSIRLTQPKN